MVKSNAFSYFSILPLITSSIGFTLFILLFRYIAYWDNDTLVWYRTGAYVFSVLSFVLVIFLMIKDYKLEKGNTILIFSYFVEIVSAILAIVTIVLTTDIIIAYQSGF